MPTWLNAFSAAAASKMLKGVDVSSFQGPPGDWTGAAGSFSWAAVKITELEPSGTRYFNADAPADWKWLASNKKGRVGYLFGHPSVSATETVNFFINRLTPMGIHDQDAVALDLEVSDGRTAAEVSAWARSVMSQLERRLDRKPLLYTFLDFARAGNCAGLGGYPLWIADPSTAAGKPTVPAPWKTWAIHQYDISGSIDRDLARYTSLAAMQAALGKPKKTPPPPPKEPPLQNLGGNVSGIASAAWPSGDMAVAGIGSNGYVQVILWNGTGWSPWSTVSPTQAKNAPSLVAWGTADGSLFYVEDSGAVVELTTTDSGQTWV